MLSKTEVNPSPKTFHREKKHTVNVDLYHVEKG